MSSTEVGWVGFPSPAKLNLFLHIVGRREDGYHLLQTVFQLLDWGDEVDLRVRDDDQICRSSDLPGVPAEQDLVVRAARQLQTVARQSSRGGGRMLGADIRVRKRIPMGGGLGGGSSNAATVLVGLNALWGLGLSFDELAELGLRLGADVPVFVHGASAWADGVGERLTPVVLGDRWYLLVNPGVAVPTAALFQAPELTRDSPITTISGFLSGSVVGNAFQPVLAARNKAVAQTLEALAPYGTPQLSGTGACCFVAFADETSAQAALRDWLLRFDAQTGSVVVARGVDVSPLRACVQGWGVAKR